MDLDNEPPLVTDPLEDWVRTPVEERDLQAFLDGCKVGANSLSEDLKHIRMKSPGGRGRQAAV